MNNKTNKGGEMRTEQEIIADINDLHKLTINYDNPVPEAYSGRFFNSPSIWHANTRLATELALVREPYILDDPKKSLAYINAI